MGWHACAIPPSLDLRPLVPLWTCLPACTSGQQAMSDNSRTWFVLVVVVVVIVGFVCFVLQPVAVRGIIFDPCVASFLYGTPTVNATGNTSEPSRGGSRGGSLGSNEPPFLLIHSTYWFLLLLPACLTIIACVPFLFGYCIIFVQSRASILRSANSMKLVFFQYF